MINWTEKLKSMQAELNQVKQSLLEYINWQLQPSYLRYDTWEDYILKKETRLPNPADKFIQQLSEQNDGRN